MTLVYDTGGLIALERGERASWVRLKGVLAREEIPITNAAVLGQVWRGRAAQARLASAVAGMEVRAVDEPVGRAAGRLLARAGLSDVVDASIVLLADDGDEIVTTDESDLRVLAEALGRYIELVRP